MKKFTSITKTRSFIFLVIFSILLFVGGCYKITSILQQASVDPKMSFDVKIFVETEDYDEVLQPAFSYLGILLPVGWVVKDSVFYDKSGYYKDDTGLFEYNENAVNFMINKMGIPPKDYYWWVAKTKYAVNFRNGESGFIKISIKAGDIPGNYKIKYVLGDDNEWNLPNPKDLFAIFDKNISDFLPISIVSAGNEERNIVFDDIKVYPNPATDKVTFSWNTNYEKLNLKLYQASGSCLIEKEISSLDNISVRNFQKGIYFYKLLNNNHIVKSGKLIIE